MKIDDKPTLVKNANLARTNKFHSTVYIIDENPSSRTDSTLQYTLLMRTPPMSDNKEENFIKP